MIEEKVKYPNLFVYLFISPFFWFLLVILLSFALYLTTLSNSVYYGDSAEFIVTALKNGVPHPPGFPLFVAIAHQFSKLPLSTVAWRINLVSAVFGALSAGTFFGSLYLLTRHRVISAVSAMFYALAPLFWIYSTVAEVFAMNNFFLALLLFLSIYVHKHPQKSYLFPIISFVFGLGLTGHQVLFFYAPALLYLLIALKIYQKPRLVIYNIIAFAIGQMPQLYLWYAARGNPYYNWGDPDSLDRLVHHILRLDYGVFKLGGFSSLQEGGAFAYLPFYAASLLRNLHVLLFFIPFGLFFLWKKDRIVFWISIVSFLLFGPVFLWFAGLPMTAIVQKGVGERFFMQSIFFAFVFMGYGIFSLWKIIIGSNQFNQAMKVGGIVVLLAALTSTLTYFYPRVNLKNNKVFEEYARNMFQTLPENSLFLVGSATTDTGLMGSIYLQQVEGLRPDIKTVSLSLLPAIWYQETLKMYYPDLTLLTLPHTGSSEFTVTLCQQAAQQPTFVDGWSPGFNPGDNRECAFVQKGLVIQLFPKDFVFDIDMYKKDSDALWAAYTIPKVASEHIFDLRTREILFFYSQARVSTGIMYLTQGREDWAKEEFEKAWSISRDNWLAASYLALLLYKEGKVDEAITLEHQALAVYPDNPDSYLHLGVWYAQKKNLGKARYYLNKYLERYPNAPDRERVLSLLKHLTSD